MPRAQTSNSVSSKAASIMAALRFLTPEQAAMLIGMGIDPMMMRSVCASALRQDEQKG